MSDTDKDDDRTAKCIRNVANFAGIKSFHMVDKKDYNPDMLSLYFDQASPKLAALFRKIEELDAHDLQTEGKHFKHMIFSDLSNSKYGVKILASAFIAKGYNMAFKPQGTTQFEMNSTETLLESKGKNVGMLMSKTFYNRPMNVKFRKETLDLYNRREANVNGDLMRFIILDQGFKEGIDLFDVKYVHLFEPLIVKSDEKQAIGRSTRFCGQRGLRFYPEFGWPLYVFRYEVNIPEALRGDLKVSNMLQLFLQYTNIDLRKVVFTQELEKACSEAAVDRELTAPIHEFTVAKPASPMDPRLQLSPIVQIGSGNLADMRKYVHRKFKKYTYPPAVLENKCAPTGTGTGTGIVKFTPTQNFVRNYFRNESPYKGILFYHSVGTGKTCSAISTATSSFDRAGYNILWVTRHTLKSDIWKNMFGQVCNLSLQRKLKNGTLKLPAKVTSPMKYLSKNWLAPISYKQFSNMLLKRNQIYNEMVKRNGEADPLRKTLVIIDEAHLLYSPSVAAAEKPNTDILEKMIQTSYNESGKDSVRVILMSGTPYTQDGMELIKLLNLLRADKDHLPVEFEDFAKEYLDDKGYFTVKGKQTFQDNISGYISYLNRSQDARYFANMVLTDVTVPLTAEPPVEYNEKGKKINKKSVIAIRKKDLRTRIKNLNATAKTAGKTMKACKAEAKKVSDEGKRLANAQKVDGRANCASKPVKVRKDCNASVTSRFKASSAQVMLKKKTSVEACKDTSKTFKETTKQEVKTIKADLDEIKKEDKAIKEQKKQFSKEIKDLSNDISRVYYRRKTIKYDLDYFKKSTSGPQRKEELKLELQNVTDALKMLRERKSRKQVEQKLMLIKAGRANLGKISQLTALKKQCRLGL